MHPFHKQCKVWPTFKLNWLCKKCAFIVTRYVPIFELEGTGGPRKKPREKMQTPPRKAPIQVSNLQKGNTVNHCTIMLRFEHAFSQKVHRSFSQPNFKTKKTTTSGNKTTWFCLCTANTGLGLSNQMLHLKTRP